MKLITEQFKDETNKNLFLIFMKYLTFIGKKHILYQIDEKHIINYIKEKNDENIEMTYLNIINFVNNFQHQTKECINISQWEDFILKLLINKTRKQILIDFLNQNKALTKFNDNIKQLSTYENIDELINTNHHIEILIDHAFLWRSTEQGFEYWSNLDDKFRKNIYYTKILINNKIKKTL